MAHVRIEQTANRTPKADGINIAMMPMRSNVPTPPISIGWHLTTCPRCGRECWYQGRTADLLKAFSPDTIFLCTECALTVMAEGTGK